MLLERIAPYRRDETEWVLSVQRTGGAEVRILFDNGKETRRWETAPNGAQMVERELSAGALGARRVYDASGRLLQEEQYTNGKLSGTTLYTWSGARLTRARTLDAAGAVLFSDDYVYASSGSLRAVRRTGQGAAQQSSVTSGAGGIFEERTGSADTLLLVRYDAKGRVASRESRSGGTTVSREDFTYKGDTTALASSAERRPGDGTVIERRYDDAGRLQAETTTTSSGAQTVDSWARDSAGHVTSRTRRSPAGLEGWTYHLRDDGSVAREEYSLRGSLQKVTIYGDGKTRTEELYRDGELFLRSFFDGDTRLKEEVWSNGTLLRTRSYS
jgi:YD repeat-containing protein